MRTVVVCFLIQILSQKMSLYYKLSSVFSSPLSSATTYQEDVRHTFQLASDLSVADSLHCEQLPSVVR